MDKGYGILIVSVTIFVLSMVGTASATNWSVDGSGGADFTGIQDAINNAKDGDSIMVHSGVYYENVVVDKSVTLIGIGHPVVDTNSSGSAITLTDDMITLVVFNVTNSGSSRKAGIKVTSNNNTITGNNVRNNSGVNGVGIRLYSSSNNNTITGNNVSNNFVGIRLYDSSNNNTITGNNVCSNNYGGISLYDSCNNNTITGNVFVNDGLYVSSSYQNIVEDNTVNGKPLVYLEDVLDYKVEDAGQVIIVNCNNVTIETLVLSNTSGSIALWKTENSKISNNTVCNNNGVGIRLDDSSSNNNTITGNNVCNNNGGGIYLHSSSNNNTITGNNVCNNNRVGIYVGSSSNNNIYFNNCINNTDNVDSYESANIWNSPLEITYTYDGTAYKSYLGNYWDDYEGKITFVNHHLRKIKDADGDGIGDIPYSIDSDSDIYPLVKPFESYNIHTSAHT